MTGKDAWIRRHRQRNRRTPAPEPEPEVEPVTRRRRSCPSAADVLAVYELLPSRYRLPLLVLDGTGMRVGELETLTWGDVDEQRGRWRIRTAASKMRAPDG